MPCGIIENNVIREKVVKHKDRAEATRIFNYPFPAVEEALVNAVYHRSYEQREPVEVRVNPDGIEIVSYPGPDASIRIEALNSDKIVARRYRNRRIGEFLKELDLTEGRCTGIPKIRAAMEKNGSPPPRFSTDEGRTYFLVELPVHPQLPGCEAHDEAHAMSASGPDGNRGQDLSFVASQTKEPPGDRRAPRSEEPKRASLQVHRPPAEPGVHRIDHPRQASEQEPEDATHREWQGVARDGMKVSADSPATTRDGGASREGARTTYFHPTLCPGVASLPGGTRPPFASAARPRRWPGSCRTRARFRGPSRPSRDSAK